MSIEHNEDIAGQMLERLPGLLQRLPNWQKFCEVFGGEVQELEDAAFKVLVDGLLVNAYGDLLDQYGDLVGEEREGLEDPEFRQILYARIRSNRSNGAPEELLKIAELMGGTDRRLFEHQPATVSVEYVHALPLGGIESERRAGILEDTRAAGVFMRIVESDSAYFGFAENPLALGFDVGKLSLRVDSNA